MQGFTLQSQLLLSVAAFCLIVTPPLAFLAANHPKAPLPPAEIESGAPVGEHHARVKADGVHLAKRWSDEGEARSDSPDAHSAAVAAMTPQAAQKPQGSKQRDAVRPAPAATNHGDGDDNDDNDEAKEAKSDTKRPRSSQSTMPVETANGTVWLHPMVRVCSARGGIRPEPSWPSTFVASVDLSESAEQGHALSAADAAACQKQCKAAAARLFAFDGSKGCRCFASIPAGAKALRPSASRGKCVTALPAAEDDPSPPATAPCASGDLRTFTNVALHTTAPWPPAHGGALVPEQREHVDVYLFVAERLGSLWRTCRLTSYSRRFDYHIYDMRFQTTPEEFIDLIVPARPGRKLLVYNSCCTHPYALQHWPPEAAMVIAGDESARWGFAHKNGRNWWGPHGDNGPLPSDEHRHIILPSGVKPWFKQYFSREHVEAFGKEVDFLPLGSRLEYADPPAVMRPAPARRYLYSFMGAPTNFIRKYLREVMEQDTLIPEELAFLHLTDHWATDPNDPRSGYINSTEYGKIMRESAFTPCPKGNSVEQYRIYEALESGSIPVIAHEGQYAQQRLPPEFFTSPMLFVHDWKEAPAAMMALWQKPAELFARQEALIQWYDRYVSERIDALESVIETHYREAAKKR